MAGVTSGLFVTLIGSGPATGRATNDNKVDLASTGNRADAVSALGRIEPNGWRALDIAGARHR